MNEWNYPGARWWKFDFHTHTPASDDFMQGVSQEKKNKVTPEYWLKKFMEKGIDCVAITDHNSGLWIDKLKDELQKLQTQRPQWYRPIHLFPGVEISATEGIHVLAIFDPKKNTSDLDTFLGAVGYSEKKGKSDCATTKSLTDVINQIVKAGGIPIPAYADQKKGLFKAMKGSPLEQVLNTSHIYAMELHDDKFQKPEIYKKKKLQWAEVRGSDTHNFRQNDFGTFTWIKMDAPSIEGLKLALMDGPTSVNSDMQADPNRHSKCIIEELSIDKARYIGREEPLNGRFSPFLNTIIGGRGSGKSTLLELARFVLRRDTEIPEPLIEESRKYFNTGGDNLLLDISRLSLIYRKGDTRYRLNWSAKADTASLEAEIANAWTAEDGDIKSLFPVYIYSQKQIFTLAQKPDALLDIIDKDPSVEYEILGQKCTDLVNRYKQLEQQARGFTEKIAQKDKLTGFLNDVTRQIEQIEKSGHKKVLQNYRQRQRQLAVIKDMEKHWRSMDSRLRKAQKEIAPISFGEQEFSEHQDMLQVLSDTNNQWIAINKDLSTLTETSEKIMRGWQEAKADAEWMKALNIDVEEYEQLRTQLEQQGIDPDKYPQLLQFQAQYQKELEEMDSYTESLARLDESKQQVLTDLQQNRKQLTKNRASFLTSVLTNNPSVGIEVKPFGQSWEGVEENIRQLLQCENYFDKDFEALKTLYHQTPEKIEAIQEIKARLVNMRKGKKETVADKRFVTHVNKLPLESISDLMCWFPQDALEITFNNNGNEQNIQQGSPGQKTAALLAFILSYGEEPLLLDQPEDDLDNELIYDLIVKQLRETKSKRQIIVVTHNANIVVNGDAEMVHCLRVANGQTHIISRSLQNNSIRKKICDTLEGGQKAFEQRYKRIHLED